MSSELICVTLSTFAQYDSAPRNRLRESGFSFRVNETGRRVTGAELVQLCREATAVIAGVEAYDADIMHQLPRLRCISRCGAGVDSIDLDAARRREVAVVNTPHIPTQAVAELTLTMILALLRNLPRQLPRARAGEWKRLDAHLLQGMTVGIVGLGRIGRRVAELLSPFGAKILAADPRADAEWAQSRGIELVSLQALLKASGVVTLHAASSEAFPLRLEAAELRSMPSGAYVVNLARGTLVDEQALHAALVEGHLAGAGLDVYPEEPYCGPLCELENVVLTPHSATLTVETRVAMETECVENAIRCLRGEIPAADRIV
jgi:D-3-phosphoglycerate dehydrogenase